MQSSIKMNKNDWIKENDDDEEYKKEIGKQNKQFIESRKIRAGAA